MSLYEARQDLANVTRTVARYFSEFLPHPAETCSEGANRAIEDDDQVALVFWHSVAEQLTK